METNEKIKRSFADSLESAKVPLITLEFLVGGKPTSFNFIIDTGANNCYIDGNIVNKLDDVIHFNNDYDLLLSSTGECKIEEVVSLKIVCGDHSFSQKFLTEDFSNIRKYILDNSGFDFAGMIGIIFFRNYKAIINYKNCTITFNSKSWSCDFSLEDILNYL